MALLPKGVTPMVPRTWENVVQHSESSVAVVRLSFEIRTLCTIWAGFPLRGREGQREDAAAGHGDGGRSHKPGSACGFFSRKGQAMGSPRMFRRNHSVDRHQVSHFLSCEVICPLEDVALTVWRGQPGVYRSVSIAV